MHVPCENVLIARRICQSCNLRGANEREVMTAVVQRLTCSGEEKWILIELVYKQFHRTIFHYLTCCYLSLKSSIHFRSTEKCSLMLLYMKVSSLKKRIEKEKQESIILYVVIRDGVYK